MAQRFKETFSYDDVRVHFVGAWYVMAIHDGFALIERYQGYHFVYRNCAWYPNASWDYRRDETCLLFPPCIGS